MRTSELQAAVSTLAGYCILLPAAHRGCTLEDEICKFPNLMMQKKVLRLEGPQEAAPALPAPESVTAAKDPFAEPNAAENGNKEGGNGEFNLKVSFSSSAPLSICSLAGHQLCSFAKSTLLHRTQDLHFGILRRSESEGWKVVRILTAMLCRVVQTLL